MKLTKLSLHFELLSKEKEKKKKKTNLPIKFKSTHSSFRVQLKSFPFDGEGTKTLEHNNLGHFY